MACWCFGLNSRVQGLRLNSKVEGLGFKGLRSAQECRREFVGTVRLC